MEEERASLLALALMVKNKMDCCVTLNAEMDLMELDQYAGKFALMGSQITEYIASSLVPMEEVLVIHYGMKINAIEKTHKVVRKMDSYGIQNVDKIITVW